MCNAQITVSSDNDSTSIIIDGKETSFSNIDLAHMFLSEGLDLAMAGDYSGAESKFKTALLYDLENPEILYNLGLAQYYQGDYENAIKTFDATAEVDPARADVYNQRGLCKAMQGNYADSETDFLIMLKYEPDFPMGNYNYGILLLQTGESEKGCGLLHKADTLGYENAAGVIMQYCDE